MNCFYAMLKNGREYTFNDRCTTVGTKVDGCLSFLDDKGVCLAIIPIGNVFAIYGSDMGEFKRRKLKINEEASK